MMGFIVIPVGISYRIIIMKPIVKSPNPQGKGLVTVLDDLQYAKKQLQISAKNIQQISSELFTSLFVLNSEIRFKPRQEQKYWLYFKDNQYRLSLIAPKQWSPEQSGRFIGACELQGDMAWTLELSEDCANDQAFIQEVAHQRQQLEDKMRQAEKVEDVLPVYVATLPFYSRVLASALAYSLRQSMQISGIAGLNLQQAKQALTNNGHISALGAER